MLAARSIAHTATAPAAEAACELLRGGLDLLRASQVAKCLCGDPAVVRNRPWRLQPGQGGQLTRRYLACARKPKALRCAFRQYLD